MGNVFSHVNKGYFTRTNHHGLSELVQVDGGFNYFTQSSHKGNFQSPTDYSYAVRRESNLVGSIYTATDYGAGGVSFERREGVLGSPGGVVTFEKLNRDSIFAAALGKILSASRNSSFNSSVALGEYKESAAIGNAVLKETRSLVRDHRFSGFIPGVTVLSRAAASAWLTYSYAIRPMMSDLFGSYELIKSDRQALYQELGKHTSSKTESWTEYGTSSEGSPVTITRTERCLVKFGGSFIIENPLIDALDRTGLTNPALLAWELVPLSFVADWFVGFGSYLDTLGGVVHSRANGHFQGYISELHHFKRAVSCKHFERYRDFPNWRTVDESWEGKYEHSRFTRTSISELPFPPPPSIKLPSASSQFLSAASLLRTIGLKRY